MRVRRSAFLVAATLCLTVSTAGAWTTPPADAPTGPDAEAAPASIESLLEALGLDILAVDMFLKIDGIEGEARASGHEDWIEIESFSWSEVRTGASGRQRGRSNVAFSDVSVVKGVDKASPYLYQACATGKHYPTAVLQVRKAGEPLEYFSIRLETVLISSVKLRSDGQDVPTEEVTLSYGKIHWEYSPQGEARPGGKVEAGWDLEANKKV